MKAVIMAGGKGTRIQSVASDVPKPMVQVLGKPILEYQIESLRKSGILELVLVVGYKSEKITSYFGDGSKWNVSIDYIVEEKPLGTAGALFYLKNKISEDFLLIFGDLMLDIDWNRFISYHMKKNSYITLFAHPNAHPYDSDILLVNDNSCVVGVDSKNNSRDYYYHNLVNAGVYCVNPAVLCEIKNDEKKDLEKDVISSFISQKRVYAYKSTEYVKDMGTPERYQSVVEDVKKCIVRKRNLANKQKCIFLDRDGTVNKLNGFVSSTEQFELLPVASKAIKQINESGYLALIATNQPVIARGECTFQELANIHMKMETELGENGAYLDDIVFCPHHPHSGYPGEISELKFDCECRKPKIGMLVKAANMYNIDLKESWYIGDTTVDIQTGINAGMRTILVKTGEAGKDEKFSGVPDYVAKDIYEAVNLILGKDI